MSGLSMEARTSNLKSIALTGLELLAFNAQKFRGPSDPDHTLSKIFKGNMHVKSEVHSFNCFKRVWLTGPLHTHTHTQTDTHLLHSVVQVNALQVPTGLRTSQRYQVWDEQGDKLCNYFQTNSTCTTTVPQCYGRTDEVQTDNLR